MIRSYTSPNMTGNQVALLPAQSTSYRILALYYTIGNTSATDTVTPELSIIYAGSYDALRVDSFAIGPLIDSAETWVRGVTARNIDNGTPPSRNNLPLPDLVITPQMSVQLEVVNGTVDQVIQEIHWLIEDEPVRRDS